MTMDLGLIKAFVMGDIDWTEMRSLGAEIDVSGATTLIREPGNVPVYEATAEDVAAGLLRRSAMGAGGLREWASVLLATGMVDVAPLEDHPHGDLLLGAVWDASKGHVLDAQTLAIAARVVQGE
jgi:hypothetical protein